MRKFIVMFIFSIAFSQEIIQLDSISNYARVKSNIIRPLSSDSLLSSFYLIITTDIKAHLHRYHTEIIYVLKGSALFILNSNEIRLKPGMMIEIPVNSKHELKMTGSEEIHVLSIQSPFYEGKDRVLD